MVYKLLIASSLLITKILTEDPPVIPDNLLSIYCLQNGRFGSETEVFKSKNIDQMDKDSTINLTLNFQAAYEQCQHDKNYNLLLLNSFIGSQKFHIEKSNSSSKPLGISGYVHYENEKLIDENLKNFEIEVPLINLIHVEENSVHFLGFKKFWSLHKIELEEKKSVIGLEKVFTVEKNFGKISAFYHPTGQENIILGFSNLQIGLINLKKNRFEGEKNLKLEKILDVSYKEKESEDKIRFITGIPGTNTAILAPTRMEILKVDYLSSKITKFPNPIDNIDHLIIPFSKNRLSQKNQIGNTTFIATSAFNHINFVGDYTTMKPLRFFTIRLPRNFLDPSLDGENPLTDKINVIEFYGYFPKSQYYLMSNQEKSYVYLYSTTFNKFDDYEEIITGITTLNWIEETSLVFYSNGGSDCGYWNVHQFEGNPEKKIEKCRNDHSTALEFKMLVLDYGRGKELESPALLNIPLIMLNKKRLFVGWDEPLNGKKVNNITWPECKEPMIQELIGEEFIKEKFGLYDGQTSVMEYFSFYSNFRLDKIDISGISNAIFSGLRLCGKCREGVYRRVKEWEIYLGKGENPMKENYSYYGKIFCQKDKREFKTEEGNEITAAVENKKMLHQLSKCDVCTFEYYPFKQQWFHTYILEGTGFPESFDLGVNQTVLTYIEEFPEIEYIDQQTGETKKYTKGGCAAGFTMNDLGICQNCASFKFQVSLMGGEQNLDHFETLRAWHCSECYTHRTTRFYRYIREYVNFDPNFFFCLEFNPFGISMSNPKYETIKNVKPTQNFVPVEGSRMRAIYEPSVVSNWINNPNATSYDFQNRFSRFETIAMMYTSPLGTVFPFQDSNPQDCLVLNFIQGRNLYISTLSKDFNVLPGYSPIILENEENHKIYDQLKFEIAIFLNQNLQKMIASQADLNYSKVFSLMKYKYTTKDNKFIYQCSGKCLLGYFYNKTSMSCLKCGYGCSQCEMFEKCDKCKAGYRMIDFKCYRGCPDGHYTKLFDGRCLSCSNDCKTCRDDISLRKEKGFQGYCYECKDKTKFIDILTGKCISECKGDKKTVEIRDKLNYCTECNLENCEVCDFYERDKCVKCKEGVELDPDERICLKKETSLIIILGMSFLGLVLVLFIAFTFILYWTNKVVVTTETEPFKEGFSSSERNGFASEDNDLPSKMGSQRM